MVSGLVLCLEASCTHAVSNAAGFFGSSGKNKVASLVGERAKKTKGKNKRRDVGGGGPPPEPVHRLKQSGCMGGYVYIA